GRNALPLNSTRSFKSHARMSQNVARIESTHLSSFAHSCHSERQRRISVPSARFFAGAQNDIGKPLRLFLSDELMHHLEGCKPCIDPGYISTRGRISMEP